MHVRLEFKEHVDACHVGCCSSYHALRRREAWHVRGDARVYTVPGDAYPARLERNEHLRPHRECRGRQQAAPESTWTAIHLAHRAAHATAPLDRCHRQHAVDSGASHPCAFRRSWGGAVYRLEWVRLHWNNRLNSELEQSLHSFPGLHKRKAGLRRTRCRQTVQRRALDLAHPDGVRTTPLGARGKTLEVRGVERRDHTSPREGERLRGVWRRARLREATASTQAAQECLGTLGALGGCPVRTSTTGMM